KGVRIRPDRHRSGAFVSWCWKRLPGDHQRRRSETRHGSGRGHVMEQFTNNKVLFIAGFGPIVGDGDASGKLYREALGISFKEESGGYFHTEALEGAKTFALWPLSQAAQSCFGRDSWPNDTLVPQAWLEFDVDSVENATAELEARGY